MLFAFLILNILAYAHALGFENTVYVPPKSPPNGGQQWYNRGCHDPLIRPAASLESHRKITDIFSANILNGRTNCPYGKQYINGQCRNVWRSSDPTRHPYALEFGNTIKVPQTCLVGQQWINGGCRDLFLKPATSSESHRKITDIFSANILHGRTNCPYGKQYINGQCRDVRGSGYLARHPYALEFGNTIKVTQICPIGQRWVNGGCRDSFLKPATSSESHRKISEISSTNTLHVRTTCPGGKHYINGQCRDVWRSADLAIFPYALWSEKTVNMPKTCSGGRQWYNGGCRDPLLKPATSPESHRYPYALRFGNTVNVPPNGSDGQQWNNGGCRDLLLKLTTSLESHRNSLLHQQLKQLWNAYATKIQEAKIKLEEKPKVVGHNSLRHINLPNQCPFGFRVDALGICCPI